MNDEYGRIAAWYDRVIDPFNRALRPIGCKLFQPEPEAKILEVGCGTGTQMAFYRSRGCLITGIDLSPAMLGVARVRLDDGTLVCRGDGSRLPYRQGAFDMVLAALVLHEMDPAIRAAVLKEMVRVLRLRGTIGIIDYHPQPRRSLKGLLARGLIRAIERAAGRRHYANFRNFIGTGGIPALADRYGLQIQRSKRVSGGTIGVYRLHRKS
jgi:ubiquinone/menaquinone biosynthesis C-methylase UbiE